MKLWLKMLILLMVCHSCNDELVFIGHHGEKKIVAVMLAEVDSTVSVKLNESQNITEDTNTTAIVNAEIQLFRNGVLLESMRSNTNGIANSTYRAKSDDTLRVAVHKEGFKVVYSQVVVPNTIELNKFDTIPARLGENLGLFVTLKDQPQSKNFYIIEVFAERWKYFLNPSTLERIDSIKIYEQIELSSVSKIFFSDQNIVTNREKYELFNDKIFDGQYYRLDLNINALSLNEGYAKSEVLSLNLKLRNINEAYYNFLTSLSLNRPIYGGPFSISSQVSGNIEGGYGILAAQTTATAKINFKR